MLNDAASPTVRPLVVKKNTAVMEGSMILCAHDLLEARWLAA